MSTKTVFISYSHFDWEVAEKLKAAFEKEDIVVVIDKKDMDPGENIQEFIESSIRKTDATISIISNKSLSSAWGAMESMTAFYNEKLQRNKRFIACYIDDDFLQPKYRDKTTKHIDSRIAELNNNRCTGAAAGVYV